MSKVTEIVRSILVREARGEEHVIATGIVLDEVDRLENENALLSKRVSELEEERDAASSTLRTLRAEMLDFDDDPVPELLSGYLEWRRDRKSHRELEHRLVEGALGRLQRRGRTERERIEVRPVRYEADNVEECLPSEAEGWGVYLRPADGGTATHVTDRSDESSARELAERLRRL